jgi:mono/diheme cytochrome c family protein
MGTYVNAVLGVLFLVLGMAAVFLMFHLWGYPFDKSTRTSAAPRWLMNLHRGIGYAYAILYVVMMWKMVPRLFAYQVEFAPRTVAHIVLGITIGFILVMKISILRWFRHLEEWMPYLGTLLLLSTVLLLGLSLPFTYKERMLAAKALGGDAFSPQNLERVKKQLAAAGFPKEAPLDELATVRNLHAGRRVLLGPCVQCHDLKTILTKPRAPQDWRETVERMADKPAVGDPIEPKQQWAAAAYLIAISPNLQESAKRTREQQEKSKNAKNAAVAGLRGGTDGAIFDEKAAKALFDSKCSECHDTSDVDKHPPLSAGDCKSLLSRMVDNGLKCDEKEIATLDWYLNKQYVKN